MNPTTHRPHEPTLETQEQITAGLLRAELAQLADAANVLLRHETEGKTAKARKQAREDRENLMARMQDILIELGEYGPHEYQILK